ncbi:8902_t:CDS:2 [Ambispora gerdemannii]|uniref:8902_t:CDS:1 n=1 Tax=Ambispora gerdemannii TaxID=144530 RepID=A0A9N9BFK1_9GLOM|nr:8902_t:CDS:2 [Ambispora gerdemannii]
MGNEHSKSLSNDKRRRSAVQFLMRNAAIVPTTSLTKVSTKSKPKVPKQPPVDEDKIEVVAPLDANGRHKYMFPVSENEVALMQMRHYLFREVWGTNFSAPVDEILRRTNARVLDIGCGPGTWVLENATEYEEACFTGIDIATLYPKEIKPQNTRFIASNILEGLPFEDNTFDFVYCRFMMFVLTLEDWQEKVIPELARVLKPNGWLEIMEGDIVWYNEPACVKDLRQKIVELLRHQRGIEPILSPLMPQMIKQCGQFSIVHQDERAAPIGKWGGNIGKANMEFVKWGAECLGDTVADSLGLKEAEYIKLLNEGFQEIGEEHVFSKTHRFWAKKIRSVENDMFIGF